VPASAVGEAKLSVSDIDACAADRRVDRRRRRLVSPRGPILLLLLVMWTGVAQPSLVAVVGNDDAVVH
jgi:hypothetical protein